MVFSLLSRFPVRHCTAICRRKATTQIVFDRELKRQQRDDSVKLDVNNDYDYLRTEIAERLVDRLDDITRTFPVGLDISCHKGHILNSLLKRDSLLSPGDCAGGVKTLVQCDMSQEALHRIPASLLNQTDKITTHVLQADEEQLPFEPNSYDIVFCNLGKYGMCL